VFQVRQLLWIVITGHIEQRYIQYGDQEFKIRVRQVPTTKYQLHILKLTAGCEGVNPLRSLITDCQYFHDSLILP